MPDSPIPYPLDPVAVSGTLITLDQYVQNPTVITRRVAEIAAQRFYAHKIFSPGPNVSGGAYLFERPNPLLTDLYAARRTQEIAPGAVVPLLTFTRGVPMVAVPRKIGGKFKLEKEERRRNDPGLVEDAITQMANTISRDMEIMALSELNAVISATSRTFAASTTLATAAAVTFSTKTAANQPSADIARLVATVDTEERGHVLDSVIYNSMDWATLVSIFAVGGADGQAGARGMLAANGITTVDVTPRQPQGRAKFYEAGRVGKWGNEFPLAEKTWEDPDTDDTWYYRNTVSPIMAVTDQFAMLEMTGL